MRKWIAHRGNNNHGYAENTKEALLAALDTDYISGIELDIRKTEDNELVIIHNPTITWNSNGIGIVKYMTLAELKEYNFGTEKNPSKICTLDELLKSTTSSKKILIEIKVDDCSDLVFETIKKYPHLNLYICSFDVKVVSTFKKEHPEYPVGLIMGKYINHNIDTSIFDFIVTQDLEQEHKEVFIWGSHAKSKLESLDPKKSIITDKAYQLYQIK